MKHLRTVMACCVICLLVIAATSCFKSTEKGSTAAAIEAAESWLEVVDRGEYGASWDQSSELFRSSVTMDGWEQSLNMARRPLGSLVSRKVESAIHATTLPGAPDGDYVVIRFATAFTNNATAVETVTPMKEGDGTWRVSGYYIK